MEKASATRSQLELYLRYQYLPLSQQVKIFDAIVRTYAAIAELDMRPRLIAFYDMTVWNEFSGSPLLPEKDHLFPICIDRVQTGKSINYRFRVKKGLAPSVRVRRGKIEFGLPRWSAYAFLVGAALTFGLNGYMKYLDIMKTRMEIDKYRIEIERMKFDLDNEKNPSRNDLDSARGLFYSVINQPNILEAEIGGISIKQTAEE
jgi:hypothetical protein